MAEAWLIELLFGLGRFFLNPALYILLLFVFLLGIRRTKRERKDFNIRIQPFNLEWSGFALSGLVAGLCVSIVMLGLGVVIPVGFIALTSLLTILFMLTMQPRLLSPAFVVSIAIVLSLLLPKLTIENSFVSKWMTDITSNSYLFMSILLAVLLFVEGFLILRKGHLHTSPKLKKSKRGKQVGLHEAKKLWMVPVLLLIPGDAITSVFQWWPVITTPFATFSLVAVPFAIGFQQQVQASLPKEAIQKTARRVLLLALIVTAFTVGAYWLPVLAVISAVIAIVGREFISFRQHTSDNNSASYFANNNNGIVILGVIPNSPAEKMSLLVGELITKVNGNEVRTEKEFYEALQVNRAYCKLEVLDYNGEVRFVQRALYDGEHHELGLLFVHDDKEWTNEAV
ncbi:MAG TPA: PDZ domain-containing protein [Bacillus bacterium]|nr:PDZ domain-containing protein [Bacillus sp. (in: firmicutes)]